MSKYEQFLIEVRDAIKEHYHSHKDNLDQSDDFYDKKKEAADNLIELVGLDNYHKLSRLIISDDMGMDVELEKGPGTKVFIYLIKHGERSCGGWFHNYF